MKQCKVEGCVSIGKLDRYGGRYLLLGYCLKHHARYKKYGDPTITKRIVGEQRHHNELYSTYCGLKQRCYYPSSISYKNYGGRGIKICDRRLGVNGFTNFTKDMGERPDGTSLDRINTNMDYCPENCKRSTKYEQVSNRRDNNECVGVRITKSNTRQARIGINKKVVHLGTFKKYDDACNARKDAEIKYGVK